MSRNDAYSFSKPQRDAIELVAGLGVRDDIHAGVTVRHRSRVAADPTQPNLRQVHLMQAELHEEVRNLGYDVAPGALGENVTTVGLDLPSLPCGTILRFGPPVEPQRDAAKAVGRAVGVTNEALASVADGGLAGGAPESSGGAPESSVAASGTAGGGVAGGGGPVIGVTGGAGLAEGVPASDAAGGGGADDVVAVARRVPLDGATEGAVAVLAAVVAAAGSGSGTGDPRPAIVVMGLRNPCQQINRFRTGLLKQVLGRDADGNLVRRAGVMAVVLRGGTVRPGDVITAELPRVVPQRALDRV
ncbi:MOSC domain-containing protein [Couchioplanes caeruleus]|uniref:transcription elongation factor n=1 Tax=Couchioplanes caeruleus TaxID=56438 RepID=UPI001FD1FD2D|nr:transcription elongation factor [Couchioplanes caeruleus]